jgi:alpha-glucosidase
VHTSARRYYTNLAYLTFWIITTLTPNSDLWWQRGIVYQVYPRSFMDSDGDGVGDLAGVRSRLDYLQELGVDALWLSPIYPSPMKDFGYDVADYTGVDPLFGTLADLDRLLEAAHARGLRVILDFVPNHTSDQHPWFLESRASRANPKRDWYIWRDAPNNWLSNFGGPAWTFDARNGQYYYHAFLPEQPDLNWRNPEVVEAMLGVLRFWLERGVDGFRVDVLWHLIKDEHFADNPANPDWREGMDPYHALIPVHSCDRPEVHDVVRRMRKLLDGYPERVLIGEIYLPLERLVQYYGVDPHGDLRGAHLPFNFQLLSAPWDAAHLAKLIAEYERLLPQGAWPNWVLGNHDRPRIASRVGPAQARVAAMLLLTLRGTPTLYYGDELGMRNVDIPPGEVQDPFERRVPGRGHGRDPVRTPMQWSAAPHGGFTTGKPWLRLSPDHQTTNVEVQDHDPRSMLALHKRLIALRRAEPALQTGAFESISTSSDVLAYLRGKTFLVALNLGSRPRRLPLPPNGTVVLSTQLDRTNERAGNILELRPDEGLIVRL